MSLPDTELHREEVGSPLRPPQFRLRTLLLAVAVVCALLTIMVSIGMAWALALILFLMLIVAHVAGNALGMRLRDGAPRPRKRTSNSGDPFAEVPFALDSKPTWQAPEESRMRKKLPVGWLLMGLTIGGAFAGGTIGGVLFHTLYRDRAGFSSILAAILSSGVMGAMAVFLIGTFIDMAHRVWREATTDPPSLEQS